MAELCRFLFSIVLGITFFAPSVFASAEMCADIFTVTEKPQITVLQEDARAAYLFGQSLDSLQKASNPQEFREGLFDLATQANNIMDQIVQDIMMIKSKMDPSLKATVHQSLSFLLQYLETNLGVPEKTLIEAAKIRYASEMKTYADRYDQQAARDSNFGFIHFPKTDGASQKNPIGFRRTKESRPPVDDVKENEQQLLQENLVDEPNPLLGTKERIGFQLYPEGTPSSPRQPIGFVHFKEVDVDRASLPNIIINMNTGLFDVFFNKLKIGY